MIVTEVPGETIARRILRDERFAARPRRRSPPSWGRRWPRSTRLDPGSVPGLVASDQVAQYRRGPRRPSASPTRPSSWGSAGWTPTDRRPSPAAVVHGDFRLGNLIVGRDGLAAVLDWELAHVGDPMEDLGWLCVKSWRFGSPLPVAGVGDLRRAVRRLRRGVGGRSTPTVVRWWEVLGTLKWGIMCIMQASAHLTGDGAEPRAGRHRPPGAARTSTTCSSS